MRVAGLYRYPLKSAAAESLRAADLEARGLAHDRRWMLVDEQGRFITGRTAPRLVLLQAEHLAHGLRLSSADLGELHCELPAADAPRLAVQVWNDQVQAVLVGDRFDRALSRWLGQPCRLVYMDEAALRMQQLLAAHAGPLSFADAAPLLLISEAAVDELNARCPQPMSMQRFRPNLVIAGCAAHAEDGWQRLRVGTAELVTTHACERCGFTAVDPHTAEIAARGEPLRTLASYRRRNSKVIFGMNAVVARAGRVELGDTVTVLD